VIGWIKLKIYSWRLNKKLRAAKTPEEIRVVADWVAKECGIPTMEQHYEANGAAPQGSLKDMQSVCDGIPLRHVKNGGTKWQEK
jgi:hypothetical protein